eukprot:g3129.t1
MPRTPRGYRRLANGLLKKTTTKRMKKQRGRKRGGNLKTTATRVTRVAKTGATTAARKAVTEAKKIFGSAAVNKAVAALKKKSNPVATALKKVTMPGGGLRRAGSGLKRAGIR